MLDEIFEMFERDNRKSGARPGGLRGRLAGMLGGGDSESWSHRRDGGNDRRGDWDDDDDDDRDDRDRRHSRRREREFFDFGD